MAPSGKIYFVSDLHLGAPDFQESLKREKHFLNWLSHVRGDMAELYILGDLFDFWFEYKRAVPKGFVRLLGSLANLCDEGVQVHIFLGNHDLWYRDYLPNEIGAHIHSKPLIKNFFGKKYYLAHGDGLGPGDHGYKLLKTISTHPISKWLFARLHPNFGIGLAHWFSSKGGNHNYGQEEEEVFFRGHDDFLYQHAFKMLETEPDIHCFVFGHRHVLVEEEIRPNSNVVILGDWIQYYSYLELSETGRKLEIFPRAT